MGVTKIEWTSFTRADGSTAPGYTFNPWRGCTKVSDGCSNCYADTLSKRNPGTLGVWGKYGTRVIASESMWKEPLKWNRAAEQDGERHRVFCASLADVFEGRESMPESVWDAVEDARIRLFELMRRTENLSWLLLTKRPDNIIPHIRLAIRSIEKAMLCYNSTYGTQTERIDSTSGSENGRTGNRSFGTNLASEEANRRPMDGGNQDDRLQTGSSGNIERFRLPSSQGHAEFDAGVRGGPPTRVGEFSRPDSTRDNNQSPRREQEQQSPIESGAGDIQPATSTRNSKTGCETLGLQRGESPEDKPDKRDGIRDSGTAAKRRDGQISSESLQHETPGSLGNLLPSHLEASSLRPLHTWLTHWLQGIPPDNVWIGTTVENQKYADIRIPELLKIPAKVRFLSMEPLLGPVNLWSDNNYPLPDGGTGSAFRWGRGVNWVIVGGESGPKARPMHVDWVRSIRDQCVEAGVPFFFKQGSQANWPDFKNFDKFPAELQRREFPNGIK